MTSSLSNNKKSISVVIPNYNGQHLLAKNLPTIFDALRYSGADFEIIVPDDCSTDNSVDFLKKNYPGVLVILGEKNLGFAGNINRGLKLASKNLVLALNSDVSVEKDYFSHQFPYFDLENTFAVMGAIHSPETKEVVKINIAANQSFAGFINTVHLKGYYYDKPIPIFFPLGANILMDNQKLKKLNYFNELYSPFYGEDIDLGLRALRYGWNSYYEPKSICYHASSVTIKKYHTKRKVRTVSRRNKLIFHDFHLEGTKYYLFYLKTFFDILTRFLIFDFFYYKALFDFLKVRQKNHYLKKTAHFKLTTQEVLVSVKEKIQKAISQQ
jgi:GT2 family glycosyltransferase